MNFQRLKHLVSINTSALPEDTDPDYQFRYIDIGSVGRGTLAEPPQDVVFGEAPSRARRVVRPGDTIISTVRTYLRAVWPVNGPTEDLIVSTGFAVLSPGRNLEPRYLGWLAQSDVVVEEVVARSVGVSYPAINAIEIGDIHVPLPSRKDQSAIADYLDAETARIDALIEKKRQVVGLLDERFESLVWAEVTGRGQRMRKATTLSWLESVPKGWGTPTVSVNFDLQLGKMLNAEASSGPEQYPYLRNVNVQWGRFDLDDLATMHFDESDRRRCELRAGDVLVCEGGEVGRAAVWDNQLSDCYFQKAIHRVRPRMGANGRYLMYCLRAAAKHNVFAVEGNLSTIVHLTGEQLRVHRFPWPPNEEQQAIVQRLDRANARTRRAKTALEQQMARLREHRQALITAAVSGHLDVPGVAA